MNGRGRISQSIVVLAWVVASLGTGRALAATVLVVRPASASAELTETVSRLHGELLSLGLEVAIAERSTARVPGAADAVLDIVGDGAPVGVDISVFDRRRGTSEVSRVALEPGAESAPGRLAIRAVEVLRSRLVEMDLIAKEQRAPAAVAPQSPAVIAPAPPLQPPSLAPRLGVEAGAAVLTSLDGMGPALMPIARLGWAARPWLALQATLAGMGSRPAVTTAAGSARVAHQYGMLGACVCAPAAQPIGLSLALAAGVLRTAVDGQADAPERGHSVARWSLLLDASVGARLRLPARYYLTVAAHVQLAEPYVAIHFVDTVVATTGRPNLLVSLTAGAWL